MDYRMESPDIIKKFLIYHETIKGHSKKTVDEYFLDLRSFFRYIKSVRNPELKNVAMDEISIDDVDIELVKSITLSDIYDYLFFLSREKPTNPHSANSHIGLNAASRARKIATIRSFYKYLTVKAHLLTENPVADLDSPKVPKTLPNYLSLSECKQLLASVKGENTERDYCILMIFLNCGLRISEIVNLKLSDIGGNYEYLRVLGKGNKERIIYLNPSTADALRNYMPVRSSLVTKEENALFVSRLHKGISKSAIHLLVKKHLSASGLDSSKYSSHKLRHTAATLMLQNGVDVRTLQEVLGHDHLNTTQIYTHVDNSDLRIAARANPLSDFNKDENN